MGGTKIRHMIEASIHKTIIYTDYFAAVSIVCQTSFNIISVEKLNFRLVKTSEYLQRFRFDVRYKPGKTNIIPDVLFRLANKKFKSLKQSLDALSMQCYFVNLIQMFPNFKRWLKQKYHDLEW